MLKYSGFFVLFGFVVSCKEKSTPLIKSISKAEFITNAIEYTYGSAKYMVYIDSDTSLHWKAIAGEELGVSGNESYVLDSITTNIFHITWAEENGIGVSQVLDFTTNKVYNHLLKGRVASASTGTIKFILEQ